MAVEAVLDFIDGLPDNQKEIAAQLHNILFHAEELTPKIRYKIPFYSRKSWICYLNPIKKNGIEMAFIRGNKLSNAQGVLESKDRKLVRGISFYTLEDIQENLILEILQEALILDDILGGT